MDNFENVVSTFKFSVKVAGETIPKAEKPWNVGDPQPQSVEGKKILVNARLFGDNPDREDFVMLDPENVVRNEKGHAIEYAGLIER